MSERPDIPEKTRTRLWVLAGGRCQYEGCNEPLWRDNLTMTEMNAAYIAHIVSATPAGPRGDKVLSPKLAKVISNLMLMCDRHHRLIDREQVAEHPVDRLTAMKKKHEARIELLTSFQEHMKSHVLIYETNVGQHAAKVVFDLAKDAMIAERRYPAEAQAIELGFCNSPAKDGTEEYWTQERENLRYWITHSLQPRVRCGDVQHLSVFAFSTQPLLIELGRLLSDIRAAEVYQLHREPPDWKWQESPDGFEFLIEEPTETHAVVALNLSLSATIDNSRITAVLPRDGLSIWRMTIPTPNNDFLKSREQLRMFRQQFRLLLDRIKARHGQDVLLHVFPAVPLSVAVEIGRVWMPKADLPLCIYDQNRELGGFAKTLEFPEDQNQEV
jgi:hypothetical protein